MHIRPIPNPTPLPPKKDKETKQTYNERWNPTFKEQFEFRSKNRKILSAFYLYFLKVKKQSKRHQSSYI